MVRANTGRPLSRAHAPNWLRAHHDGAAAPVVLASTNERTLDVVDLEVLRQYAVDVPPDPGDLSTD